MNLVSRKVQFPLTVPSSIFQSGFDDKAAADTVKSHRRAVKDTVYIYITIMAQRNGIRILNVRVEQHQDRKQWKAIPIKLDTNVVNSVIPRFLINWRDTESKIPPQHTGSLWLLAHIISLKISHLNMNYIRHCLNLTMTLSFSHTIQSNITERLIIEIFCNDFTCEFHGNSLLIHVQLIIVNSFKICTIELKLLYGKVVNAMKD